MSARHFFRAFLVLHLIVLVAACNHNPPKAVYDDNVNKKKKSHYTYTSRKMPVNRGSSRSAPDEQQKYSQALEGKNQADSTQEESVKRTQPVKQTEPVKLPRTRTKVRTVGSFEVTPTEAPLKVEPQKRVEVAIEQEKKVTVVEEAKPDQKKPVAEPKPILKPKPIPKPTLTPPVKVASANVAKKTEPKKVNKPLTKPESLEPKSVDTKASPVTPKKVSKAPVNSFTLEDLPLAFGRWTLDLSGEQCLLSSRGLSMEDGQGGTPVTLVVSDKNLSILTRSNIDVSYSGTGVSFDGSKRLPLEQIENETNLIFTEQREVFLKRMVAGSRMDLVVGFWPTWPKTKANRVSIPLNQFSTALNAWKRCNTQIKSDTL